jgi:hypothetical protein
MKPLDEHRWYWNKDLMAIRDWHGGAKLVARDQSTMLGAAFQRVRRGLLRPSHSPKTHDGCRVK